MKLLQHATEAFQSDERIRRWLDTIVPRNAFADSRCHKQKESYTAESQNELTIDMSHLAAPPNTRMERTLPKDGPERDRFRQRKSCRALEDSEYRQANLHTSEFQGPAKYEDDCGQPSYPPEYSTIEPKKRRAGKTETRPDLYSPTQHGRKQASSCQEDEAIIESPSKKYARRKRHKTKADKYEFKENRKINESLRPRGRMHTGATSRRKRTGSVLNAGFEASNVESERLTLGRPSGRGLFCKGKSSALSEHRDVPDLTFSAMDFLSNPQRDKRSTQEMVMNDMFKREDRKRKAQEMANLFSMNGDDRVNDRARQKRVQHVRGDLGGQMYASNAHGKCTNLLTDHHRKHEQYSSVLHRYKDEELHLGCPKKRKISEISNTDNIATNRPSTSTSLLVASDQVITESCSVIHSHADEYDRNDIRGSGTHKALVSISSLEQYTRKALISNQPGMWRTLEDVEKAAPVVSAADLRHVAKETDSKRVTPSKFDVDASQSLKEICDYENRSVEQLNLVDYEYLQTPESLPLASSVCQREFWNVDSAENDWWISALNTNRRFEFEDVVKETLEIAPQQDKVPDSSSLELLAQSDIDVLKHLRSDMRYNGPIKGLDCSLKQGSLQSYLPALQAYFGDSLSTPYRTAESTDHSLYNYGSSVYNDGYSRWNVKHDPILTAPSINNLDRTSTHASSRSRRTYTAPLDKAKETIAKGLQLHADLRGAATLLSDVGQTLGTLSWTDHDPHDLHKGCSLNLSGETGLRYKSNLTRNIDSPSPFLGLSRPYLLY